MAWGIDQCGGGGETSSAGVVDKLWEPLLAVLASTRYSCLGHGRKRQSKFWSANCSGEPRINANECYTTFVTKCAGQIRVFGLMGVPAAHSVQSEYGDT